LLSMSLNRQDAKTPSDENESKNTHAPITAE